MECQPRQEGEYSFSYQQLNTWSESDMSFSATFIDPVHWETRKAILLCAWKERELSIFCIQPTDFIPTDFIHPLL